MIELLSKQGIHTVTDDNYRILVRTYPQLNVMNELKKMKAWLEANPAKRKVNTERFVINWLNKARPSPVGSIDVEASGHYAVVAERTRHEDPIIPARPETVAENIRKLKGMLGMNR